MSGKLEQLDNDALLVLYLAGELSNGDKAAVERRLANEPALAAELQRLRELQAFCVSTIKTADEQARMPVGEGVAVRRVARAMAQWQVDHRRAAPAAAKRGLPLPWWAYPTAAAAAIIIGFLVWSSRQPLVGEAKPDIAFNQQQEEPPDLSDWMDSSFGITAEANAEDVFSATPAGVPSGGGDDAGGGSMFPTREETTSEQAS